MKLGHVKMTGINTKNDTIYNHSNTLTINLFIRTTKIGVTRN